MIAYKHHTVFIGQPMYAFARQTGLRHHRPRHKARLASDRASQHAGVTGPQCRACPGWGRRVQRRAGLAGMTVIAKLSLPQLAMLQYSAAHHLR